MVEHTEIFCAQIDLDPFGEVESSAQREIGLIDRVGAAQPVPEVVSLRDCRAPGHWARHRIRHASIFLSQTCGTIF
jgi:hypothetical protein